MNSSSDLPIEDNSLSQPTYEELLQKLKEMEARESLYRSLAENTSDLFYRTDTEGRIVFLSQSAYALSGYTVEESLGMNMAEDVYLVPEEREVFLCLLREHGRVQNFQARLKRKDGSVWWAMTSAHYYYDGHGNIAGVEGITRDITAQRQALETSVRQKDEAQRYLDIAGVMIGALDQNGNVTLLNQKGSQILGFQEPELIGKNWVKTVIPERYRSQMQQDLDQFFSGTLSIPEFSEAKVVTRSGEERIIAFHNTLLRNDQDICGILFSGEDITERKFTERQLRNSEDRFRTTFKTIPDSICLTNIDDGTITDVNDGFVRIMGYSPEEVLGHTTYRLRFWKNVNDRKDLIRRLQTEEYVENMEADFIAKDGTVLRGLISARTVELNGQRMILTVIRDITLHKRLEIERQRLEEKMVQSQKLESLGILAGGVAHDFNNLLAAIMGHAELTKRRLPPGTSALANLQQIENAAERAADLARQMLAYSGRGHFILEHIDLNDLLQEMMHMLQVSISKKVLLRLIPYTPLPAVSVDATQIRQILMNLVINASEAIGENSGVITISTSLRVCDQQDLKTLWIDEDLKAGEYVSLEVSDSGCGMDEETIHKIFDPFFSTKFTGRGLGMSAVLGIVRGHKGAIRIYSEPGKGTTFNVLLPVSSQTAQPLEIEVNDDDWQGDGKVLLVDDEESARRIGVEMLEELGFDVVTASDGREALNLYKSVADIGFVILDLTMPNMDGEQCYRELKKITPELKVLMSSGYNEAEVCQRFSGKKLAGFVQKPYKLTTLKHVVRKVFQGND